MSTGKIYKNHIISNQNVGKPDNFYMEFSTFQDAYQKYVGAPETSENLMRSVVYFFGTS